MRRLLVGACVFAGILTGSAQAADPPAVTVPKLGHFRSVLAQGEGQQLNLFEFGQYQASGSPPPTHTKQQPLYVDIMPRATSLTANDLDVFYKPTDFGSMPGGVGTNESPRAG